MTTSAHIAVIEDDTSLRQALSALVRSVGYRVSDHESAEAFLEHGDLDDVDCIVTDIQMPGISGIDLKLHLAGHAPHLPVIMITARPEQALLERARASGALCLLQKPFHADDLLACIERALDA